ncbi:hypothetical protein D3C81_1448920 [compost metagenome]
MFEGDGQHRLVRGRRIDVPGHRGAAAIGDQQAILFPGELQQFTDLPGGLRVGHAVGKHTELAFAHRQPVRQALAAGVQYAVAGIADDQRMLGQARGRHFRQHAVEAGIGQRVAGADQFGEECPAGVRQCHVRSFVAPTVPASHAPLLFRCPALAAYTSQPPGTVTVGSGQPHSPIETQQECTASARLRFPPCRSTCAMPNSSAWTSTPRYRPPA